MENGVLRNSSINWIFFCRLPMQNHLKLSTEKRRNNSEYLTCNSIRLKFAKKNCIPKPVKSLAYIKCHSSSSPRLVKSSSNAIRHNCQKMYSWSRRPKTILAIKKRSYFFRWSTILIFTSFSKTSLTMKRRLTGKWFLVVDLFQTFLNTGATNETFQQSRKQDSLRHTLNTPARMYESSDSKFLTTTTGIQSGLDTFDESRCVMTFFNHFGSYRNIMQFLISSKRENGEKYLSHQD